MTVAIRKDVLTEEVYARARKEKNSRARARMLGIAAILEGKRRGHAAQIAGLAINNLSIWVQRFNELGLEGLCGKKYPGKQLGWPPEIEQFLKEKALEGASFEKDQRVTYRLKDFQKMILDIFGILYGISTIWYELKRLDLSWVSVRQKHPKTNSAAQEEFKKKPPMRLGNYKIAIQTRK